MVTIDKIQKGIAKYLDSELMTKIPSSGVQKFLAATVSTIAIKKMAIYVESLKKNKTLLAMDIFNEAGEIDVDTICQALKENMPMDGLKVEIPMLGQATFNPSDVDTLYKYITE